MIIMTPNQKLDFVLKAMQRIDGHYMDMSEISKLSEIIGKVNINEVPSILNKLYKDGYLDVETGRSKDVIFESNKKYMINFEGKLLNESGGYQYKTKREYRSTRLEKTQTWSIAIGTALAGIYAIVQLIIVFRNYCH